MDNRNGRKAWQVLEGEPWGQSRGITVCASVRHSIYNANRCEVSRHREDAVLLLKRESGENGESEGVMGSYGIRGTFTLHSGLLA